MKWDTKTLKLKTSTVEFLSSVARLNNSIVFLSAGPIGYGSDYEEESRYTPNGPVTSSQPPFNSHENELLKQQLIDHHRDSPRPPFSQPQMVQGMTANYAHNYRIINRIALFTLSS